MHSRSICAVQQQSVCGLENVIHLCKYRVVQFMARHYQRPSHKESSNEQNVDILYEIGYIAVYCLVISKRILDTTRK